MSDAVAINTAGCYSGCDRLLLKIVPASGDARARSRRRDRDWRRWTDVAMRVGELLGPIVGSNASRSAGRILFTGGRKLRCRFKRTTGAESKSSGLSAGNTENRAGEAVFDFWFGLKARWSSASFWASGKGILQTDTLMQWPANDIGGPQLAHVGCWAHASAASLSMLW